MKAIGSGETRDSILGGRLALIQPKQGYRFSVEAILLGRFVRASTRERVLELGAGCGVISIMIASIHGPREVVAVEIQPELAEMIARNAALNDLESVRAICADLRQKKIAGVELRSRNRESSLSRNFERPREPRSWPANRPRREFRNACRLHPGRR
jgi:tRNA1(Val) A37 N6-methylase TrmN6